jgi:DNA-binding beta-propeller fold protein YncE
MRISSGRHTYEWLDHWARIPDTESARTGWAHHGVVVSETGSIIAFHQAEPTVLVFDEEGGLERSWGTTAENAHGMALVKEGSTEYLWLADNLTGQVLKTTLDGETVMSIERPDLEIYRDGKYSPTGTAVNEERHGGNGDIWVTDGYGESHIHRYDKSGGYIGSINGEDGEGGAFQTPHAVWIDTRKPEHELYVADRSNGQVQVYDLEGGFKRAFGTGPGASWLHSPSAFAVHGEFMLVVELRGSRVTVLDAEDNLVGYLGENTGAFKLQEGWPNVQRETLTEGKFNSPHGIATDSAGNIYVAEWLIGGRMVKLAAV